MSQRWTQIAAAIAEAIGEPFAPGAPRDLGGGCINRAVRLDDGRRTFFVKVNSADRLDMFEAEAAGLEALAAAGGLRVPRVVASGLAGDQAWLALEFLFLGRPRGESAERAGRGLAELHRGTWGAFGWWRDNTIGSTPQPNGAERDWVRFWRERRLGFQLDLAARHGHGGPLQARGERLLEALPKLLTHDPAPSLLHGDLWGGNLGYLEDGTPVVYDPAVYYGDREADLAMTELFGGFPGRFYAAYHEAWPLDPGYGARKTLYNLYHILNHLNLFGGGYLGQALGMIDRLLAELA